ncbi:hypothetical protein BG841_08735 [Marinobacter sp. X15-166B]|nr:hypothetical protein BG841_08735 [Marinobacter sp. X15-166B]
MQEYCFTVGWFDDAEQAGAAAKSIPVAQDAAVVARERALAPWYWVLLPPANTKADALARVREFQRQGVDSYMVTSGPHENAISLGLFESRAAAESVIVQKSKKNLHPTLVLYPRNRLSYALDFKAAYAPDSEELGEVGRDLSQQFEMLAIKRCEGVATAE